MLEMLHASGCVLHNVKRGRPSRCELLREGKTVSLQTQLRILQAWPRLLVHVKAIRALLAQKKSVSVLLDALSRSFIPVVRKKAAV
jgi:hypothetical protein